MKIFTSRQQKLGCLALMALLPLSLMAATKEVHLKSGERLVGEVLSSSDAKTLHLRSKILGELTLPRSAIASTRDLPIPKPPATPKPTVAAKAVPKSPPVPAKPRPAPKPAGELAESEEKSFFRLWKSVSDFKTPASWSGNLRLGLNINTGSSDWAERYARGQLSIQPKGS